MAGTTKRVHLTKTMVEKLAKPAKGKAFLWDDDPPGLGVVITTNGTKSYIIDYTTRDGTRRRLVLGRCDRMSLEQARIDARGKLSSADLGGDPVAERKAGRLKQRMDDLLDDYINIEMPTLKKQSTIDLHKGQIEKYIRPEFGAMAIIDITAEHIAKLHREAAAKAAKVKKDGKGGSAGQGGKVAANRVLAIMSAIMSYAVRQKIRADNPCRGIKKFKESGRTRYLTETELQAVAHELTISPAQDGCDVIRLCMLTGCRSGEAMSARFEMFDLTDKKVWTKPAATTKQKTVHHVPLSPDAIELIKKRRRLANGDWLFPARWALEDHKPHMTSIRSLWAGICKRAGLKGVHIHDLRHTYASILVSLGHSLPIIGKLLGHADAKTTQRYAHLFDEPLRAATNAVADLLNTQASKADQRAKSDEAGESDSKKP